MRSLIGDSPPSVLLGWDRKGGKLMTVSHASREIAERVHILDSHNQPVLLAEAVAAFYRDENEKRLYVQNSYLWLNFFKEDPLTKNPQLMKRKLMDGVLLTRFFGEEDWPGLHQFVKNMEVFLRAIGLLVDTKTPPTNKQLT